jgi:hypothetical protein
LALRDLLLLSGGGFDGEHYRTQLDDVAIVGATIDIGFPVVVTEAKTVAGGGMLVKARHTS